MSHPWMLGVIAMSAVGGSVVLSSVFDKQERASEVSELVHTINIPTATDLANHGVSQRIERTLNLEEREVRMLLHRAQDEYPDMQEILVEMQHRLENDQPVGDLEHRLRRMAESDGFERFLRYFTE